MIENFDANDEYRLLRDIEDGRLGGRGLTIDQIMMEYNVGIDTVQRMLGIAIPKNQAVRLGERDYLFPINGESEERFGELLELMYYYFATAITIHLPIALSERIEVLVEIEAELTELSINEWTRYLHNRIAFARELIGHSADEDVCYLMLARTAARLKLFAPTIRMLDIEKHVLQADTEPGMLAVFYKLGGQKMMKGLRERKADIVLDTMRTRVKQFYAGYKRGYESRYGIELQEINLDTSLECIPLLL